MNDKYYLMDVLNTEKNFSVNLVYAMNEASTKKIYNEYVNAFKSINKLVKDTFNLAYSLGFYKIEAETEKKINTAKKELTNELNSNN